MKRPDTPDTKVTQPQTGAKGLFGGRVADPKLVEDAKRAPEHGVFSLGESIGPLAAETPILDEQLVVSKRGPYAAAARASLAPSTPSMCNTRS